MKVFGAMNRTVGLAVLITVVVVACGCAQERAGSTSTAYVPVAQEFVSHLAEGDFIAAEERFDSTMKAALPPEKLKEVWDSLTTQFGPFKAQASTRTETTGQFEIVYVTCEFEKGRTDLKVVFSGSGEISGLWNVPTPSPDALKPPDYIRPDSFTEKDVTIGAGEWKLPGTLSTPKGQGPFPAAVLVHGSGPHDRDETLGPNKPFKDIAQGLASSGIAVLRYEKRTRAYQEKMALMQDVTVKEEIIDDALAAVNLLRSENNIDPKRVFILGHSLGGTIAPKIAKADPKIAGLIILAGSTTAMEDAILKQMKYILSLDGLSEEDEQQLEGVKRQAARVKDPKLSKNTPSSQIFGVPASYWLDLRGYQPAELASTLKVPMLVLQGGRDYQVTTADFETWKKALAARKNVEFKLYPKLNHIFVEGQGKSTPAEYEQPGHVSKIVIQNIANWIKSVQ